MDPQMSRSIARLAVAVMAADGRITASELDALSNLDDLGLGRLSGLAREEIERAVGRPIDVEATCDALGDLDPDATALVLAALAEMAASDRVLSPLEIDVFTAVASRLGLSGDEAASILEAAVSPPATGAPTWQTIPVGTAEPEASRVAREARPAETVPPDPQLERAHRILGVEPGAERVRLEAAYLALVQRYNPARMAELGVEFAVLAVRRLASVTAAFETALGALAGGGADGPD
jgi:uncharacterized tellurite resistance protein B-like protein